MLAGATLRALCKQVELFERAAKYEGRPRERLVALGVAEELYFCLYPHHYRALQTIRIASQLGRPGLRRAEPLRQCESKLLSLLVKVILQGVDVQDRQLRNPQGPEELAFTIWILAFGTRALMDTSVARSQLGIDDGVRVTRDSIDMFLDALGWQPLTAECDYAVMRENIRKELFMDEWEQVRRARTSSDA